ncbi:zinc finger SWIM domain-containing protein 8 isoform X1 [Syngnathus acus]|uniref:zinc finger SWIM domain-containing protein 8 isoform X1 n=1 Tax=Syngnathus acus TaxID=161584 RepID=UPI001885F6F3|nr:zinc finger SWIM domain-containing protein 8 isoform X1 [Syngnathus acus]
MELMFAEWEEGERFSFEDSDRFEEDSLCSFISEAESLCQNWRGWKKQSAGATSPTARATDGQVIPLVELSAKQVAFHIPFEVVEKVYPPVPEQLQLRIAYWSFPENEDDIRLYSCLANGSPDEFQRGEQLHRIRAVKDPLQIGFHLSASVVPSQSGQSRGTYNVAVMFDRCRITSCSCTCGAGAKWCAHVVALCLFRIHNASAVCLRAPVSESLSRLQRDQLQKFAQYLISELPQQILPTAQRLLDELLSSQSTAINTLCGAPDPTAGPSVSDQSTWYLDESTLSDNIKKTLHKFCGPSPVVFSDVNSMYLSSTEPPAAAEWACLLRPLRGREPEGIWNLLSIVREMFKRRDSNAAPLLEILTEHCLTYEQIISWWYSVRTSASHSSASGHTGRTNGQSDVAAHACASMCDEIVVLWKLAVLDPTISPCRRLELASQLKHRHLKVIEIVKRGQHRKSLDKLFQGFKPAVESCYFNWQMAYPLEGITSCHAEKKTANLSWPRGMQQQRAARASAAASAIREASELRGADCHSRGSARSSFQEEVVVRPKEMVLTKKKTIAVNGGGTMLVRLGGGALSLSLEDGEGKCFYKGTGSASGGKLKLMKGFGKGGILGGCQNINAKQRTSSEDSSLEPDLAELSLDDGCSLTLGAEASNTFEYIPPASMGFPSNAPLPQESSCKNGKILDCKHSSSHATVAFKETDVAVFDVSEQFEYRTQQEDSEETRDVKPVHGDQPLANSCDGSSAEPLGGLEEKMRAGTEAENREAAVCGIAPKEAEASNGGGLVVCEDDYQLYYLSPASEEGAYRQLVDSHEDGPDIFAGIKPLEQEERMEVLFACAESLHAHGYNNEACRLAVDLAKELLANPPDLKVEQPQTKGKKNKVSTGRQTQVATNTFSKAAFLITVLSDRPELHNLVFNTGMFSLELQRPPASTKALEVKLAYQESDIVALLKKLPMGLPEMSLIRERAVQLRDGNYCGYRPVPPLMLASFIFDVLSAPVVSPTGCSSSSRKVSSEKPGDEELGFDAAVSALGMKTTVSEAEHPLLCEGTRRVKGDLALALMITYKDDQTKLKKILDKLLDREGQTHKPQTLSSFYSNKPAASSQRSPSKHGPSTSCGSTSFNSTSAAAAAAAAALARQEPADEQKSVQNSTAGRSAPNLVPGGNQSDYQSESSTFKLDNTVSSRVALGERCGYSQRCWGSPARQKKKHTGTTGSMASIDSSAPETTSDSSPTLSRRPLRGGWTATSWGRGQDSDSISSSSSDSLGSSSSSGSNRAGCGARAKSTDTSRYKGRRPECHAPHVPNQPSEAAAHFYFELAKTVLIKAGGNSSTSIFTQPSVSGVHQGPHRNLHLCAFEIGLYALGLHNFVSPNWLSRTYSSHVSWITGQAMEIGSAALNILMECWDGHLTPPEVASLADRASRARDLNMVRAAAELALSCLPHAHALNPNEIQRALVQCKEQDNAMLEKACVAVEEAAKGGGVYPEVLFEVAHQWYWLYEHSIIGGGLSQQRETLGRCGAKGCVSRRTPETSCGVGTTNAESAGVAVTAAAAIVPVISVGSNIYQSHGMSGQVMVHAHTHGLHPYATIQTHLPTVCPPLCSPQYLGHPLQHTPRPAVFPLSGGTYPQGIHPAFFGAQYPFSVATAPSPSMAASAVSFPAIPVPPMTQIAYPYHSESSLPMNSTVAVGNLHTGSTFQAIQGSSLSSQPSLLASTSYPAEDEHLQPISQQGMHYLHSAYRVGMLALEMLGRRAHNDHPNNFSRSPPYTDDVKWLLALASRLGVNYVYQFCVGAAKGVLSPFVLQEIIMEALQRLNPAHFHTHLRTPAFHQLVQRCQHSYLQYIHHRLIHLTPADYDDFVNIIRSARAAFCLTPVGVMQLNDVLQNLKRGKQTKELWQRISMEMATFSP